SPVEPPGRHPARGRSSTSRRLWHQPCSAATAMEILWNAFSQAAPHHDRGAPKLRRWDLRSLVSDEKQRLLQRTHPLERRIFARSEPFEVYHRRVASSDASQQIVWTFEDAHGRLVGYNFVFLHHLVRDGRPIAVMRTNTALLPEYRRHNRIVGAGIAPCL